jgi:hypothetical protein
MKPRPHPPSRPHGTIAQVLPGVHFVTGTIAVPGPVPVTFSRAMTILQEGDRLVLVNSVRLDDAGLQALDALGKVTDVVRLAGNHGSDDPFYKERYGAKVWAADGAPYIPGFSANAEPYFEPDIRFDERTEMPLGARPHLFHGKPVEAVIVLERSGGVAIAGDALQNWAAYDPFFNWLAKPMMKMGGFMKPHNVGPAWLRQTKPPAADLRKVLELPFDHLFPAHGTPVIRGARDKYRSAIEAAISARS